MQKSRATPDVYEWKPWTSGLSWRGLLVVTLTEVFPGRATLDELYDVLRRHPAVVAQPPWKQRVKELLEGSPAEFGLDGNGRWGFANEDEARAAYRHISDEGPDAWVQFVPDGVRWMVEAKWKQICAE
jgi:hypothetical protein